MTKHSHHPKVSPIGHPASESIALDPSSALPSQIPVSTTPAKPDRIGDAELDRPEEGVDPTLPGNIAHGAPGHQVKEPDNEDEDDEGRSLTEQLIDAGAQEAEEDKVQQAGREAAKNNRG
jgi:hypothetical protein